MLITKRARRIIQATRLKVSERGKITILHNLRFLNGLKDLKTIFRLKKKKPRKILFLLKVITRKRLFAYQLLN